MQSEQEKFSTAHPKSKSLFARAGKSLLGGVPMNWMAKWAGAFPPFVSEAHGAEVVDVDGHRYIDFCLGDTAAMTGHSPQPTVSAAQSQLDRGISLMLPSEDAIWVGEELQRRFHLPYWQFALTATDANRFSIRLARHITRRQKILVFNWCYHGTVDEAFITLKDGVSRARAGNIGPPVDPSITTKVVEFNDLAALEIALQPGDVACVLAEPALTNVGIVHPAPDYHRQLRELTRKHKTLLIIDETHTICAGPGGFTRAENLDPDFLVFGKAIGAGIPGAAYGFTQEVADAVSAGMNLEDCDVGGIGGTLAGNALARHPLGLPRRISLFAESRAHWYRGSRRHGLRTRAFHAFIRDESRNPANPVPQHGSHVSRHHRRPCRSPHRSLLARGPSFDQLAHPHNQNHAEGAPGWIFSLGLGVGSAT
jgi:glutamate-1-semialdehyde 2,1-aminomutase